MSLTQGFVLSAFIALMYERTGIAWAQLAGLVTLMVAVVLLASRSSIPARYTGTDPAVSSGR